MDYLSLQRANQIGNVNSNYSLIKRSTDEKVSYAGSHRNILPRRECTVPSEERMQEAVPKD